MFILGWEGSFARKNGEYRLFHVALLQKETSNLKEPTDRNL